MLRGMFKKKANRTAAPAFVIPASKDPLLLACGSLEFLVGFTTRRAIEARLGPAVEYPAPGWRTWAAAGNRGDCWILSAIYRGQVLIGIEHYVAKTENLPRDTPPANGLYTLMPGEIAIGNRVSALPDRFRSAGGKEGGARSIVYQRASKRAGRTASRSCAATTAASSGSRSTRTTRCRRSKHRANVDAAAIRL
jgi:hypothetical protein